MMEVNGKEVALNGLIGTVTNSTQVLPVSEPQQRQNMNYFEKKYGMKTEDFYKKFKTGVLGDDMDFFEWKATVKFRLIREFIGDNIRPSSEPNFVEILKKIGEQVH